MVRDEQLESLDVFALDDGALEAENRMKNLMWTVSGDYQLDTKLDLQSFSESKYVSMYDAVKQGAFAKWFDKDAFGLYLAKKLYYEADMMRLTNIAQLCVDAAVYPKVLEKRPGVSEIREEAFSYLLDKRFRLLNETMIGKIKLAYMRGFLSGSWENPERIAVHLNPIRELEKSKDTLDLIRVVDGLYNRIVDPTFERRHGSLEKVLATTLEEMKELDWRSFMEEEAYEEYLKKFAEDVSNQVTSFDNQEAPEETEQKQQRRKQRVIQLDAAAVQKMFGYIEKSYGRSYLSETEQKRRNYSLCQGAHADCSLYYTDGIVDNRVMVNAQYANAVRHMKNNQRLFLNNKNLLKRNVEILTAVLQRAILLRTMSEEIPSNHGNVVPKKLWKIGRVEDPGKLFYQRTKTSSTDFAVEILIDASASQSDRQGQVALQAYILSAALSNAQIPHRIEGFCTFWDYTVMTRFRDFDDPASRDKDVLKFYTSANNRDGLAFRAAGDILLQRAEENRVLIILSDGRPNDLVINRPGSRNPSLYTGDYAVNDTAYEVRRLRSAGIRVMGVYTGLESDLAAEKKIFGRDFAYTRDIRNFSKITGLYLQRVLEQDTGEL